MSRAYCFLFILILFSCNKSDENVLRIAASANAQFAIEKIVAAFESETGVKTEVILGSSGKLSAQISEGAPFDIFVSADTRNPEFLAKGGHTSGDPRVYARGRLVLWSLVHPKDSLLSYLKQGLFKKVATANPVTAPYGIATEEALKRLTLFDKYEEKLVFGESISQTNLLISTKAVDAGFTALSIVLSDKLKSQGAWVEIDSSLYNSLDQAAVMLNDKEATQKFYDFLFSEKSAEIFEEFGYFTIK